MSEAPKRIEIPLTVEHDGETVEIGRLCYVREDVAERENAELRELVRDWREFAVGGADSLTDWNHTEAELEQRMSELGIEVDE